MPSLSQHEARAAVARADEFPQGAADWPREISRRDFLQMMAASFALAGLTGCARERPRSIVPRVTPAEPGGNAGELQYFATAMPFEGFGRGILVRTNSGRPTKIEGNPDHPESRGATDVFTQAAILSLYDPDRSAAPRRLGQPSTWAEFEAEWLALRGELAARKGAGLALLTEPTTSPTLRRELQRVLDAFPAARWFQHTPLGRYDRGGHQFDFDFARSDVILSLQSDCFYRHPAAVRYGRAFADRRRVENGRVDPPRFYALEPTPTVTGALADFRLPVSPSRLRAVLDRVARQVGMGVPPVRPDEFGSSGKPDSGFNLSADELAFARALADDITAHKGRVACSAGVECDPDIRAWAEVLNGRAGAEVAFRRPALRSDSDPRCAGDAHALAEALMQGDVGALIVLGSNPLYTAPRELALAESFKRVRFTVHLGESCDETGALARWHLPESHFLETWSDLCGYDGSFVIQQPVVAPLHAGRSCAEILRLISDAPGVAGYEIVRETWRASHGGDGADFEAQWRAWLDRGVAEARKENAAPGSAVAAEFPKLSRAAERESITIVLQPDPNILDGRWANNAWLQELPKPLTHLTWENAALVSPALAAEHALENGDVIACEVGGSALDVPIRIQPGQAATIVTLSLGYGRTRAGAVGNQRGYDAYRFRRATESWERPDATIRKLGRKHALVSTHDHFSLEGRDLIRVVTLAEPAAEVKPAGQGSASAAGSPSSGGSAAPAASLFPPWPRDRHAWGMVIDLSTCLGCNACVIACQAENNIPVVGPEQVARGREMHWLRIDRYLSGPEENPRFLHQPVPCMQCENAPCEVVCPVAATVHSSEGLNDMVYNRCVGTRYCSNNCPYKVRRFNFLDYRVPPDLECGDLAPLSKAAPGRRTPNRKGDAHPYLNPDVTVRSRGVMEKCTYCVQRINAGRIAADIANRPLRDGEIQTACQQVCPAQAIVFGDLSDAKSRVARRRAEPLNYALLEELNTRPRTTYLPKVVRSGRRNPEPA